MTIRLRPACAVLSSLVILSVTLASCGGDEVAERPAHRPISVIYVAGEPEGPWRARTEGLADGVKLAIAERNGLIGERAVSTVVVPALQRDGATVSAAVGGGRILRDSRAIAVLATYSAPQLALAAPQLNGGELTLLQYGTGMVGLTGAEVTGEPGRYEPSGRRYALRGVPSDAAVAARVRSISDLRGAQVVPVTTTYDASLITASAERAKLARSTRAQAKEDGDDPLPGTSPALTNPSPERPDAKRLAAQIAKAIGGTVVAPGAVRPGRPTVVVTDPTEPDPTAAARRALGGIRSAALVVDAADRAIDPSRLARASTATTYEIRRTVADAGTAKSQAIRARERSAFGRDRGDAVVAGYLAARRILDLAARQPDRTIDRVAYADALVGAAPGDPNLPATAAGEATLGTVELRELRGGRWVARD